MGSEPAPGGGDAAGAGDGEGEGFDGLVPEELLEALGLARAEVVTTSAGEFPDRARPLLRASELASSRTRSRVRPSGLRCSADRFRGLARASSRDPSS
jgi:hypothetical protein